jgi:hypothetical protein
MVKKDYIKVVLPLIIIIGLFFIFTHNSGRSAGCTDTDSGKQYYLVGSIPESGGGTDVCINTTTLKEFFCSTSATPYPTYINYRCSDGCANGICKPSPSCSLSQSQNCPSVGSACMTSTLLCTETFLYNNNYYCNIDNTVCGTKCIGNPPTAKCENPSVCIEGYMECRDGHPYKCISGTWSNTDTCTTSPPEVCRYVSYNNAYCEPASLSECSSGSDCCAKYGSNCGANGLSSSKQVTSAPFCSGNFVYIKYKLHSCSLGDCDIGAETSTSIQECVSPNVCQNGACVNSPCQAWSCGTWGPCIIGSQARTCTVASTCSPNTKTETQTCTVSCVKGETTNCDGKVSKTELLAYISNWLKGTVQMQDIIEVIKYYLRYM